MTSTNPLFERSHRRRNPLTGEWVVVSPHRLSRPWQGLNEVKMSNKRPHYDPECYLCPGNVRANGVKNPQYTETYVFDNDFPALMSAQANEHFNHLTDTLMAAQPANGIAKVICFSPDHSLSMAKMNEKDITAVISTWQGEVNEISKTYQWVQVFENKGDIMGCSNPHPHGQIWACDFLPTEADKEHRQQQTYYQNHQSNLLIDYVKREQNAQERIVLENDEWLVVVPFWAVWPFETLLIPKSHCAHLNHLNENQKIKLASILKALLQKYDRLFGVSFPYSMGWHGSPYAKDDPFWQLHAHFYPPLLRSASVKKFMVGFEMLAESQRDITPEDAAKRLSIL
ncbi:UDP-glucose--hexose-1-phosphate uridylyltransferase [Cysteiniphilum halobium]|uniref:UDP-glucose--hexose-1-phosphate uridylyltransferase n=1 Tax=Cysteiniphilum halobium TaxID=2219059 RepID=UPI000E646DE0|nr:UDP-glucose--hexose-1-phosphate uridylyltransferase [Cysteiniphilum halobium]